MEKLILVVYLNTSEMTPEKSIMEMERISHKVASAIEGENIIHFVIPSRETRVECINPRLVTENEYAKAKDTLKRINKILEP